jgi:hypothetical protein
LVFLLDCEEYFLQSRLIARGKEEGRIDDNLAAVASKISYFKENTLPVVKSLDDDGKLVLVNIVFFCFEMMAVHFRIAVQMLIFYMESIGQVKD